MIAWVALGAAFVVGVPASWASTSTTASAAIGDAGLHLIDMVVAQVDETVFTLSELVAETRLVLLRSKGPLAAERSTLTQPLLNSVLASMIHRELLSREIRRLQLRELPDNEIEHDVLMVRRMFASAADYERFLDFAGFRELGGDVGVLRGVPPLLASILRMERLVDRFVELRVRANVTVSETEVRECYDARKGEFESVPLSSVAQSLRAKIASAKSKEELGTLIRDLVRRASIRFAPSFEALSEELNALPEVERCAS